MSRSDGTYEHISDERIAEWLMYFWQNLYGTNETVKAPKSVAAFRQCFSHFEDRMRVLKTRFESE